LNGRHIAVFDNSDSRVNIYNLKGNIINSRNDGTSFAGGMTFLSDNEVIIRRNTSSVADIWNFNNNSFVVLNLNIAENNSFRHSLLTENYTPVITRDRLFLCYR